MARCGLNQEGGNTASLIAFEIPIGECSHGWVLAEKLCWGLLKTGSSVMSSLVIVLGLL